VGVQIFYQDAHIFGGDIVELDGNLLRAAIGVSLVARVTVPVTIRGEPA